MTSMDQEIALSGGNENVVVQVGETVRRPVHSWTPAVHALLRQLESAGFAESPRVLGFDEQGREILTMIPGTVGNHPIVAGDGDRCVAGGLRPDAPPLPLSGHDPAWLG